MARKPQSGRPWPTPSPPRAWVAALVGGLLVAGCRGNGAGESRLGPGGSPIDTLANAYVEAVLSADADAYLALYAPDAVQLPPGEAAVVGNRAIAGRFAQSPMHAGSTAPVSFWGFSWGLDGGAGDLAYDHGPYVFRVPGDEEPATVFEGTYVVVLRRLDGDWKIWREAWTR